MNTMKMIFQEIFAQNKMIKASTKIFTSLIIIYFFMRRVTEMLIRKFHMMT